MLNQVHFKLDICWGSATEDTAFGRVFFSVSILKKSKVEVKWTKLGALS